MIIYGYLDEVYRRDGKEPLTARWVEIDWPQQSVIYKRRKKIVVKIFFKDAEDI